jgi:hypothetical protein
MTPTLHSHKVITKFVKDQLEMMVEYAREKYHAPDLKVDPILSFAKGIKTSRGGHINNNTYMKLAVWRYANAYELGININEFEYKHYRNDPVIGELRGVHWTKGLSLLIAHELAHVIQFSPNTVTAAKVSVGLDTLDNRNQILKGHDWFFQRIYADLRSQFVNSFDQFGFVETFEPEAPKRTRSTTGPRKINKGWYSKEVCKNGGRYGYYYRDDKSLIGCLFNRWKEPVYIYNTETNEYTPTGVYTTREARKIAFGI